MTGSDDESALSEVDMLLQYLNKQQETEMEVKVRKENY
jgi:acetyl-CoA carboxylase carboxyltransferase component